MSAKLPYQSEVSSRSPAHRDYNITAGERGQRQVNYSDAVELTDCRSSEEGAVNYWTARMIEWH